MAETVYTYETKGLTNVETFDTRGYVTLYRDGVFKYEHQFSTAGVRLQELELLTQLEKHKVDYKVTPELGHEGELETV